MSRKIKKLTIPVGVTGAEAGGLIIGRWFSASELRTTRNAPGLYHIGKHPKIKGLYYGIRRAPVKQGKYYGGVVQFKNMIPSPEGGGGINATHFKLPNVFTIQMRLIPLFIRYWLRDDVIGLWHSQPTHADPSREDEESMKAYLKQSRKDRLIMGVVYNRIMDIWVYEKGI